MKNHRPPAWRVDDLPVLIQGGMGIAVSGWRLAQSVARAGQMGVVSGTALDAVYARRLQLGDPTGEIRKALAKHPWPDMARRVLERWWRKDGLAEDEPFEPTPMPTVPLTPEHTDLLVTAAYCEVALAREGHNGPIGINLLEKVQLPTLPILLGAMLAGVSAVLMGGGLPMAIPGVLDGLARGEPVELRIDCAGLGEHEAIYQTLDPQALADGSLPELVRPVFLGIVSTEAVARALLRRANGTVDGFVVEHYRAGGHNAPPRHAAQANRSEPSYGPRDEPDLAALRALERPFWLAGGMGSPQALQQALEAGARGVQVGTAFTACEESGFTPAIKAALTEQARAGTLRVRTDFRASPTGYPFKVSNVPEPEGQACEGTRRRLCDLGHLRTVVLRRDGRIGYRCPAGLQSAWLAAGGSPEELEGRCCLCNSLLAAIGLGQRRGTYVEPPIVTLGEDWSPLRALATRLGREYRASDVVTYLLGA